MTKVPVGPLRQAVETSGMSWSEVARRMDFVETTVHPDVTRLKRMLGVKAANGVYGHHCTERNAHRLMRALDLDPVDLGL